MNTFSKRFGNIINYKTKIIYFLAQRLSNFYILITDSNPTLKGPVYSESYLCAYYTCSPPVNSTVSIKCAESSCGRYLVIQLEETNYLTLCEVQVFPVLQTGTKSHCN